MRILTFDEYKKTSQEWCDKYIEFRTKLLKLAIHEDLIPMARYNKWDEAETTDARMEIFDQYEGYMSTSDANFGCYLTMENVDELLDTHTNNSRWKDYIRAIGNRIRIENKDISGVLTGIVNSIKDIYYEIKTDNGEIIYETALSKKEVIG